MPPNVKIARRPDTTVPSARVSSSRPSPRSDASEGGASTKLGLNYNGIQLAFDSDAGNFAPGAQAGVQNVFQRANPLNSLTIFATGFD